ncbi:COP1-interactive protein 1 [Electrophorus electricus]|uniref:COP1-interactive protein 1 n=1 Tax=Electrophorus electricus TaxID=8005 RepID=UPI0015D05339|nr:COP1-interactive protein 1 [Electrophorus electricus]
MLEAEIKETMNSIQQQKKTDTSMCRGLNVISAVLINKDEQVKDLSKRISKLEKNITRLTASQLKCHEEHEHKCKKSEEIARKRELYEKELQDVRKTFQQKIKAVREKIPELETEIEEGRKVNSDHLESITKLSSTFCVQRRREDEALEEQRKLSRQLSKSKQRLEERIASIAKYNLEVKEMEEQMKQLQETNIVSTEMFQKNVEELEGQLSKERMSRVVFEVKRDELSQSLESLKDQHKHRVGELSSMIALMKTRHRKLQEEEKKLQDHVAMSSLIEHLTNKVTSAEEECRQMETDYQAEILQLTMDAELITQARLDEEETLKAKRSVLQQVETQYETHHTRHQTLQKQTTELNSRKNNLEISIQEVKEQTATLLGSKVEIKQELEALRAKHRETLANQAAEISATEKSIYENGLMLEQVNMENSRLHLCIEQLKEEISNAKKDKEKYMQEMTWMQQEVQALCRSLMEDWVIDKLVTEESTERDKKVLEGMHGFMVMIRTRMHQIGEINSRVEKELAAMSSLWENTKPQ